MFLLLLPKVVFFCFLTPGVFLNLTCLSITQILWPNSALVIISYGVVDISLDIQTMLSGLKENSSINKRKVMYRLCYFMQRTFTRISKLIFSHCNKWPICATQHYPISAFITAPRAQNWTWQLCDIIFSTFLKLLVFRAMALWILLYSLQRYTN